MHCPQCGQRQASSEMRFCSRCGFPLGGVAELLASGGVLDARGGDELRQESLSPRYKGVRQGVLMLLLGAVVVPILGVLNAQQDTAFLQVLVGLSAVIFFVGGMMRILYASLFEKGAAGKIPFAREYTAPAAPAQLNSATRATALPPAQSIPVSGFNQTRRVNTAELTPQPPSVTENTTRLLDEEKGMRRE